MPTAATFVIDFGSVENAYLVAELDEERNNGKTSFQAGDTVHFKIFSNCDYTIEVTDGSIVNGSEDVEEAVEDEICLFVKGEPVSVQKKVKTGVSISSTWFGNNLGVITKSDTNQIQASGADDDTLGIASVSYTSEYNEHTLNPPSGMPTTYHIMIYIEATS